MNTMEYKGFIGSIEVSIEDNCLHGKIIHSVDLVTYEASTVEDLKKEFEAAVDDYITTCAEVGIEPLKSFSGTLNVRIGPDLHKKIALAALKNETSINNEIKIAVENHMKKNKRTEIHNHTHKHENKYLLIQNNDNAPSNLYGAPIRQDLIEKKYKSLN